MSAVLPRDPTLPDVRAAAALLAVADRARGRGLARVLLEDAFAHADAHGLPVHLECEPHLERLYADFGFETTGTLEHDLGGRVTQRTMLRPSAQVRAVCMGE